MPSTDPRSRDQELLDERARLIADTIAKTPGLREAIQDGIAEAEKGEGVPAKEYFDRWPNEHTKPT